MIQILALRDRFDEKKQTSVKYEAFFDKKWRAPSVKELFKNIDSYISSIPEDARFNIFYTVADCAEEKGRKLVEQNVIPFDVDNINVEKIDETVDALLFILKVPRDKVGVVFSGNGVQVIVGTTHGFKDKKFFEQTREHYRNICNQVTAELKRRDLPGICDPSVWTPARLMRLPKTLNVKPNKPQREARLLNAIIEDLDFSLQKISDLPQVARDEQVSETVLKRYPPPDVNAVLTNCDFIKRCKEDPKTLPEPEWYGLLSILGRLPDGRKLAHEYSKGHGSYTPEETDQKLDQAIAASGPLTCKKINSLWGKCATCKHFNTTIISPIVIRGPGYIKTKDFGFHELKHDAHGDPKPGKPVYEDLRRYFEQEAPYVTAEGSGLVYRWNKTHWEQWPENKVKAFAQNNFKPVANNMMASEFLGLVQRTNVKPFDWFGKSTERLMNFKNGVLDIDTMKMSPHSPEYGFRYTLPYDYDPEASCSRFVQFLDEVTLGREELSKILMEFAGYAFSNDNCWAQKALLLVGEGANGKSTFMDVLKQLAGDDNYSSVPLADLKNDVNRYQLEGKLFNMAEETAATSLLDSSLFKNLVSGGKTMVKMLYHQPFSITNRAKLMFAANEIPRSQDTTTALLRRFIIVPFDASFLHNGDPFLDKKLREELPGIFNLVIEGYKRMLSQGAFSHSRVVQDQILEYQAQIDPLVEFVDDCLEVFELTLENTSKFFTSTQKIFDAYKDFSERRGEKPSPMHGFFKLLSRKLPDYEKRKERKRVESGRERGLKAVILRQTTHF